MFTKLLLGFAAPAVLIGLCGGQVSAQQARVQNYVASTGSDGNACTRTSPCRTFAGALAKTSANGEINVLDSAEYGSFVINQPVYIIAKGVTATVSPAAGDAIAINIPNGGAVTLKGLTLAGNQYSNNAVNVIYATDLQIEDCDISGFPFGLLVSSKAQSRVHVFRSSIYQNATAIQITAGSFVNGVVIDQSSLDYNTVNGVAFNGTNGAVLVGNSSIQGGPALSTGSGTPSVQSFGDNRIYNTFPASIIQHQ